MKKRAVILFVPMLLVILSCTTTYNVKNSGTSPDEEESFYVQKGISFANKNDYPTAIECFTNALYKNEKDVDAYYHRGNVYLEIGQYEKAIEDYSKLLRLNNIHGYQITPTWINRGNAYRLIGKYEDALHNFTRVIIDSSHNSDLSDAYGLDNSKKAFDKMLETAYFYRALTYHALEDNNSAILDYTNAIKLNPDNFAYYNNLAQCFLSNGDYSNAIIYYTKTINRNKRYAQAYYRRGVSYLALNDFINAEKDFQEAIKLEPENDTFKQALQIFYE